MTLSMKQHILSFFFILCIVMMVCCLYAYGKNPAQELPVRDKYFTSVEIKPGDSLTSIANQYMTYEYSSVKEYIDEVRYINGFMGDKIYAGTHLIIPYYAN